MSNFSEKHKEFPSGAILRRKNEENIEIWELDNRTLWDSTFNLDLSRWEGMNFTDSKNKSKTVKIQHMNSMDMFSIQYDSKYKYAPVFELLEIPISLQEQK